VWRTRVGYAGGTSPAPTYRSIGDHTECFQVDFDPLTIRYEELVELFWSVHNPTAAAYSKQYASLILAHDERQLTVAKSLRDRLEAVVRRPVLTRIEMLERFYPAEDYHQKYRLRNTPELMNEFRTMYPDDAAFVASTAAARVNGYLDGSGTCGQLGREVDRLGLSAAAAARLQARCAR